MVFRNLFIFSFLLLSSLCHAQVDREPLPAGNDAEIVPARSNRVYGKLVDKNNKAIEAASVQLFLIQQDSVQDGDSLIGGMLSKANGDFSIEQIPSGAQLRIVISAIGYEKKEMLLEIPPGQAKGFQKDLGNIILEPAIKELGEVTITAQRPGLVMGIDRKIFNVENSLVASGGTGLDVMRNIPSVSVDVEGNVLLRNSSPQIFVDGRPTILTLDQIPADNIERVELITNPSARFDAASDGGIINVILKKNKRVGLNGIISAGAGVPKQLNGNVNLNIREGRFNFFTIASFNQSGGIAKSRTLRQNKENGVVTDFFNQYSRGDRLRQFGSLRFGFDFFADNRNTVSITQNIVAGRNSNEEGQDQEFLDINKQPVFFGERTSNGRSLFNRYNTQLNYTHKFPEQGKELNANINYNRGLGSDYSIIINSFLNPDGTTYSPTNEVRNNGSNKNNQWTFQADLTDPGENDSKVEFGVRSFLNKYISQFNAYSVQNGSGHLLPISNHYSYEEFVNAVYGTYTGKKEKWGYQFGLRAEYSRFEGVLIDSALKFGYEYPNKLARIWDAIFPSVFLTKQLGDDVEMQLNYSRRIRRPNFWQLNPVIDISDPVNLRQGNPQLRPEFINSFEFNYSHGFGKGNNFLGVIYFRNNPGDITRYSDTISAAAYQQLNNAAVDPNAILNTFINAQTTNRLGIELTLQQKLGDHFDVTPTFDFQYRSVKANVSGLNLDNSGASWEGKLILNYKTTITRPSPFRNFSIQVIGEYESPEVQAQGRSLAEYEVDLAFRKDFGKDKKANLAFSIRDLFNTLRFGNVYDTDNYYQDSYWRRNVRSFRIVFTYKFGKADFSLRRNRQNNDGDSED